MSFNDKMHPRNIYKTKKPNFKLLAEKYEKFKEVVKEDAKGRVHVDFRDPECLKLLTWVLLKEDFNLDVDIPLSRLIPTVPLRLNYLLWVEDLFAHEFPSTHLRGFDIGELNFLFSFSSEQVRTIFAHRDRSFMHIPLVGSSHEPMDLHC